MEKIKRRKKSYPIYLFKEEFCQTLGIPAYQYDRRQAELLEWLKNFFDYEIIPGRPIRIMIKAIIGDYRPLPRKKYSAELREATLQEAKQDYKDYTLACLSPTEYEPLSKIRIAREAITEFGSYKYHHSNAEYIAKNYVSDTFDENAESNKKQVWVYYTTYEPIEQEVLEEWRGILKEEKIGEEEAAKAFYKAAQGQNISKEKKYYKNAVQRFQQKYEDMPVLVSCYKLKEESAF